MGDLEEKTKKKRNHGRKRGAGPKEGPEDSQAGSSRSQTETQALHQHRGPPLGDQLQGKQQPVFPEAKISQDLQRNVHIGDRGISLSGYMSGPPPIPAFSKKSGAYGAPQAQPLLQEYQQQPPAPQQPNPQPWGKQEPHQQHQPPQPWRQPPQGHQQPQVSGKQQQKRLQETPQSQSQQEPPQQQIEEKPQPAAPADQPKKDQSWKKKAQKKEKIERQKSSIQESDSSKKIPSSSSSQATPHFDELSVAICPYKGSGTRGKLNKIETNYVDLRLNKLVDVSYHYNVAIDPDRPKKLMKDVFEAFRLKNFANYTMAYDRRENAYSIQKLPVEPEGFTDEIQIPDDANSRKKTFKVTIKLTNDCEVKMNLLKSGKAYLVEKDRGRVLKAHQCLEIILRMAATGGLNVGRNYYWRPERPSKLDDFMELWNGVFHSAIFGSSRLLLNVDITNKGFPMEMDVIDFLAKVGIVPNRQVQKKSLDQAMDHLSGLNISYALPGNQASRRLYKFLKFAGPANQETFTTDDGKTQTVAQYFIGKGIPLRFPYLPLLHCGPKNKNIYLPAEFCTIPGGQAVMKKLTDKQTRAMIKDTATSTDVRKNKILKILNQVKFNNSQVVKDFGIEVGDKFLRLESRILPTPDLEYAEKRKETPRDGVWRPSQFIVPTSIGNWAVLCLEEYDPNMGAIQEFVDRIRSVGKSLNMTIPSPLQIAQKSKRDRDIDEFMEKCKGKLEILLVVIPEFGKVYQKVKTSAETKYGVLTQCVKHKTVETVAQRRNDQIVGNILLKINSKLNGLNHRIMSSNKLGVLQDGNFIVVGADVTHPSPEQRDIPSIVGVAASYDEDGFQYTGMWRIQVPGKEKILDLATIMEDHLKFYREKRKTLPHTIIYYRDGVGEGDFKNMLDIEFQAIRNAAALLQPNYKPKIVFIIVQKRHHTRFFPEKGGITSGRNNNVPPGTVVDKEIVPPNQNHFFMVAHQAIQGVAKPTKYCILVDEANMSIDDLQTLTYNLCYMFTRCNRSVSYVAPTYYAHLMAARGKAYIEGSSQKLNMDNLQMEYQNRLVKTEVCQDHPMFFV
ncbi:Protein argonaute-2 [Sergentomyia squamirostris]